MAGFDKPSNECTANVLGVTSGESKESHLPSIQGKTKRFEKESPQEEKKKGGKLKSLLRRLLSKLVKPEAPKTFDKQPPAVYRPTTSILPNSNPKVVNSSESAPEKAEEDKFQVTSKSPVATLLSSNSIPSSRSLLRNDSRFSAILPTNACSPYSEETSLRSLSNLSANGEGSCLEDASDGRAGELPEASTVTEVPGDTTLFSQVPIVEEVGEEEGGGREVSEERGGSNDVVEERTGGGLNGGIGGGEEGMKEEALEASSPAFRRPEDAAGPTSTASSASAASEISDNSTESALDPTKPHIRDATVAAEERHDFLPLIQALKNGDQIEQRQVAASLHALTKRKEDALNRARLAAAGGIAPVLSLLYSPDPITVEHAVSTVLNSALSDPVKGYIFAANGVQSLVKTLREGNTVSRENAAAAIYLLTNNDERREAFRAGDAVPALLAMLAPGGTLRGKKDASLALFNLSLNARCRKDIVREGGVPILLSLLQDEPALEDKAMAALLSLVKGPEGASAVARESGVPILATLLEVGGPRCREDAAAALLLLAKKLPDTVVAMENEGVRPPLIQMAQGGTTRGRVKAQELISIIRGFSRSDSSISQVTA